MAYRFVFNHLDRSRALISYTQQKLDHLMEKYLSRDPKVRVSFSRLGPKRIAHCDVWGLKGVEFHTEVKSNSLYGAVNKMAFRLGRQLSKKKEIATDRKGAKPREVMASLEPQGDESVGLL